MTGVTQQFIASCILPTPLEFIEKQVIIIQNCGWPSYLINGDRQMKEPKESGDYVLVLQTNFYPRFDE